MIRPEPWRRITAAACFMVNGTPFRLTPMTLSQSARSTVSMFWPPSTANPGVAAMPALAMTTSSPPSAATASSISA